MRYLNDVMFLTLIFTSALFARSSAEPEERADTVLRARTVEEVTFRSGQLQIVGNLYLPGPGAAPSPVVIWVSGSGPSLRTLKNKETIKLVNCFLENGVAYFRIDKPGYGDSQGKINDDSLFAQLSDVVVAAVEKLKNHSSIDRTKIGLFGSSQAGYIMPLAISKCRDIAFMMGSSCPGENSIAQWNYLLEHQLLCAGVSPQEAKQKIEMFTILRCTTNKQAFDGAIEYFEKNPLLLKSLGYDSSFSERAKSWWPRQIDSTDESHFQPMTLIEKTRIPLYLVYGAHDTQINPFQAMDAYARACRISGNKQYRITLLNDSDHNMSLSGGCLKEIEQLNKNNVYRFDPEYLKTIRSWIDEISKN